MHGDDVEELDVELRHLGYSIDEVEISERVFRDTTRGAVRNSQEQRRVAVTGVVDVATATLLDTEVGAITTDRELALDASSSVDASNTTLHNFAPPNGPSVGRIGYGKKVPQPGLEWSNEDMT